MAEGNSKREIALSRWASLSAERTSFIEHWRDLAHYTLPRAELYLEAAGLGSTNPTEGQKKHQHIYDNTPTRSLNVLTAGLMSGMTSPARPWFRLRTPDDSLNERPAVKEWLDKVEKQMRNVFNQSNTYRTFRYIYKQLGLFGTAATVCLPDFDDVLRHNPLSAGEYAVDINDKGQVDVLYRTFDMSVDQMVRRFGLERVSTSVKNAYEMRNLTAKHRVLHAIEPRRERDPLKLDNKNMPYASCYYEMGGEDGSYLRESGYKLFPALVPRWEVSAGTSRYGSECPGMIALGDTKQLQHQQLRKSQAIDYQTMPPLQVPISKQPGGVRITPGAVNFIDQTGTGAKSMFDVNLDLQHLLADIADVRYRIKQAYYEDLFLLIANTPYGQPPTAREVSERHEEKLIMLGPVLESLHDEFLHPQIEMAFAYMLEAGMVPPPPPELSGMPLVIKFVSLLAQAQQLVGLGAVDRLIGTVFNLAQLKPDILDKIDTDQIVDVYSDLLGTDPSLIVADENVALVRQQKAKAMAAQQAVAAAPQVASAAKDISLAKPEGINAAVDALRSLGGVP